MPNHKTDLEGRMDPTKFSPIEEIDHNALFNLKVTLEDVMRFHNEMWRTEVKFFRIQEWMGHEDYDVEPVNILFIDEDGNGYRLGYNSYYDEWYYTIISEYRVRYWAGQFFVTELKYKVSFEEEQTLEAQYSMLKENLN